MTLSENTAPWSLSDLFPGHDSPEMKKAFDEMDSLITAFETLRPQLSAQMPVDSFLDAVRRLEAIHHLGNRVYGFAGLSFSANTQDQAIQTFMGNVEQTLAVMENRLLFFSLWWKDLAEADVARFMEAAGDYRYWLEEMRHFKPHTLSEPEEKIVNLKNVTGSSAINTLYSTITNRYTFKIVVDGETKELTRGEVMVYARSADPALRAAAYQELYRVYGDDSSILGQMYQALVRDWKNENLDLRHFSTPLAARNLQNDIPDDVVDILLDVARRNATIFQRFFKLKARKLGMEKLRRYDIYAPVAAADKAYPFGDGSHMVLESFGHFDPRIEGLARRVFDQAHLDSEVRKGKRGGAFCWSAVPGLTPWVHVNYQGKAEDVATLAHELGHAIHAMLAEQHSVFTFHSSLPLAETASTFGEMMLVDRLLAAETDENVRRVLLFRQVDDAYATIMRQSYFAIFERTAHQMIADGAGVDELAKAYLDNLAEQFGEAVEVADEFRWEWISIPHIYNTPFYVYAYAFGQLLVLSLYQQYKLEGEAFKPRYLKILAAGGSDAPERILKAAGIDIHSPAFWQGGFDVLSRLVDDLATL
jgi:oligoendopeptidase F